MKKFITMLLVVLMLACFTAGIVACSGGHTCHFCGKSGATHEMLLTQNEKVWMCDDCYHDWGYYD
ncbi:MAG: hypothetical protein IJM20_07735 [Clostridia bacterium]|jgi:hypothetical protein|nr:hypothetical protein [Clostridia bacterium]